MKQRKILTIKAIQEQGSTATLNLNLPKNPTIELLQAACASLSGEELEPMPIPQDEEEAEEQCLYIQAVADRLQEITRAFPGACSRQHEKRTSAAKEADPDPTIPF